MERGVSLFMSRRALARAYMDVPTGLFVATAAATTAAAASLYYSMAQLTQANEGIQQIRAVQDRNDKSAQIFLKHALEQMNMFKSDRVNSKEALPSYVDTRSADKSDKTAAPPFDRGVGDTYATYRQNPSDLRPKSRGEQAQRGSKSASSDEGQ